jgi:hypothetical protein
MGEECSGAKFEIKGLSCGWGAFVQITMPHGKIEHIVGFKTEAEAKEWIATKSAGWLAEHSSQRRSRGEIA